MNMNSNDRALQEAFFSKKNKLEKTKESLTQYTPAGKDENLGKVSSPFDSIFAVSDTEEAKKRLVSSFGAIVGNNTVKTMANKAIKTFPIIISEDIEPETAVNIKRLMEEQYADYISLLVSNQVVDISEFMTNRDGSNIAIQALDKLSGADFSKRQGLATKTKDGKLSLNDIAKNDYLYNLLRHESADFISGEPGMDSLLEDAMIIPSVSAEDIALVEELIMEAGSAVVKHLSDGAGKDRNTTFSDIIKAKGGNEEKFLNMSMYDVLMKDQAILDRFQKATFLLETMKITPAEYISYLTIRLGMPLTKEMKMIILEKNPSNMISIDNEYPMLSNADINLLSGKDGSNKIKRLSKALKSITMQDVKDVLKYSAAAAGSGLTIGLGIASLIKSGAIAGGTSIFEGLSIPIISACLSSPIFAAAMLATGLISGSVAIAIKKARDKRLSDSKYVQSKSNSWKRVEALIEIMEAQRRDVKKAYELSKKLDNKEIEFKEDKYLEPRTLDKALNDYMHGVNIKVEDKKQLRENDEFKYYTALEYTISPVELQESINEFERALEDVKIDPEYKAEKLQEAVISSTTPIEVRPKYQFNSKKVEFNAVPAYATGSDVAYGSVEYDKREIKDRRYNQPLIIKVKFRQRFSDGSLDDNELTAVIGIMGVINRVPSDEMKHILLANEEGNVLKGIFKPESKKSSDIIDIISRFTKKSRDASKLPVSKDIWDNLEKVSKLAAINAISGKQNNNISNAHIVFSMKEIEEVKSEEGIDYIRNKDLVAQLMKRYSAFTIMIANDVGERLYIFDDLDAINWNVVPYSILRTGSANDQLSAALLKIRDMR